MLRGKDVERCRVEDKIGEGRWGRGRKESDEAHS